MNGVLLVDKPVGLTSHDVVDRIRAAAGMRRVGHTGTLDPAATGLLILCLGPTTRLSEFLVGMDKVYEGTLRLGLVTDSYDLQGNTVEEREVPQLKPADIQTVFDRFQGDILQTPPMVSAVKVKGERLYKKARKGEIVQREPRRITVHEFRLLSYDAPDAAFRLRCTRGTYARSLCHDVGQELGCGGTLASLRRTWVGKHSVEQARPVEHFKCKEDVKERILPAGDALDLPTVVVNEARRKTVLSGSALEPADIGTPPAPVTGWVQIKTLSGELLAVGQMGSGVDAGRVLPKRVLAK